MKYLLTLLFIILSISSYSQTSNMNDTILIFARPFENSLYYENSNYTNRLIDEPFNKNDIIIVYDIENEYYKGILFRDNMDISVHKTQLLFEAFNQQNYIDSLNGNANFRKEFILKELTSYKKQIELKKELTKYQNYSKKGIVLTDKSYAYEEYGPAFGLNLEFYNGFKKNIKYIDLTVRSYNRVGDPISDYFGKSVARPKVIGPLETDSSASVTFDDLFYDERDVISYLVITYMKITFMDGTIKEIKNVNNHLGEDVYNGTGK